MATYAILRLTWWFLLGILLMGFAVMDGFDLGVAALLPFVARKDIERRVVLNTVGPVWEGNQVWFIVAGASIFAAWPLLYAASFSGFYLAMFLVLATLILRPVGFKFRSKLENVRWRAFWDWALFCGGVLTPLVFGVAFGNLFEGVPFGMDDDLRLHSTITLFSLLNPFAILVGLVSLSMLVLHGASWLNHKCVGPVQARARTIMPFAAGAFILLFGLAGVWLSHKTGYRIVDAIAHDGPSNPLLKQVIRGNMGWFANYAAHPAFWLAPILAMLGAAGAALLRRRSLPALLSSASVPALTIATAGLALFPFLLPSSSEPGSSLTIWDASSSKLTLEIMLGVVVLMLPIIIAYSAIAYHVMRGPVSAQSVARDSKSSY